MGSFLILFVVLLDVILQGFSTYDDSTYDDCLWGQLQHFFFLYLIFRTTYATFSFDVEIYVDI